MKLQEKKGMTLIEIILVLVLLGSVMAIVGNKAMKSFEKGNIKAAQIQIMQMEGWLDMYRLDCHTYPTTEQGLEALVSKPVQSPDCPDYDPDGYAGQKGEIPLDPWGSPYIYENTDGRKYRITSLGPDRQAGGEGNDEDISNE